MKKELNRYDIIEGFTEFDEWSYCTDNQFWYEDSKEVLPEPIAQSEMVSDFICDIKVNHDGMYCDNWDEVSENKGELEEFANFLVGENNYADCTWSAVLFKTREQLLIMNFNDYGFWSLENFIEKLKVQSFATEYSENAESRKFIAWTNESEQTRFVIYSYNECPAYIETSIDITVNRTVLINKLENIIKIWKETVYNAVKEQEKLLKKKAENPFCEASVNHFFPEFRTPVCKVIESNLKYLERKHNIRILFAVENGSRAWNMPSKNSDYDIRFVFKRNVEDYLSLTAPKDVFELYLDEEYYPCEAENALIDMVGFDLQKYIGLLIKSNPTAIEWLLSDIVYLGSNNIPIKKYIVENFNRRTLIYHYISMCKKHYNKSLKEDKKVTSKKYLYMMRALLNSLYIYKENSLPPLDFAETIELLKDDIPEKIYITLKEIIKIKKTEREKDEISRIECLDGFINEYLCKEFKVSENRIDAKIINDYMISEIIANKVKNLNSKEKNNNPIYSLIINLVLLFLIFLLLNLFII